jgi:hypothetical protein
MTQKMNRMIYIAVLICLFEGLCSSAFADHNFCWQFPHVTYGQMATQEVALCEEKSKALIFSLGPTSFVSEDSTYVGPKNHPLTWIIAVSKHDAGYTSSIRCFNTETGESMLRSMIMGTTIENLYDQISEITSASNGFYYSKMTYDSERLPTKLALGVLDTNENKMLDTNTLAIAHRTVDDMINSLVNDPTVVFCERQYIGKMIKAHDVIAVNNHFPFQIRSGRIISSRYIIAPNATTNDSGAAILEFKLIDSIEGKIVHRYTRFLGDPSLTGSNVAASIKQELITQNEKDIQHAPPAGRVEAPRP